MWLRTSVALFLLATAGGIASFAPTAESNGEERSRFDTRCRPPGARLAVANRYARVYHRVRTYSELDYCRPGRREPEITLFAEEVYPPPAISLAGPFLGYAGIVSEPGTNDNVVVVDARRNSVVSLIDAGGGVAGGGVGSLKVNRRGSVAWIVCPFGQVAGTLDCTLGGGEGPDRTPRSIYRHDSRSTKAEPVQLVARSRRIEVRSLRRKGERIYWTEAGKTRSAIFR